MELETAVTISAGFAGAAGYAFRAVSDYIKGRANTESKFLARIEALEKKIDQKDGLIDSLQAQVRQLETKVEQLEQERDHLLKSVALKAPGPHV